jgi:DNA primase
MYQEHTADIGEVPDSNLSVRHHGSERFDVTALRRSHPIETVVAASGVELARRGQGFMGCCPLHDDSTASLSVGGVPDRFHCFGCGARGDVIEYVARFTGLAFVDAVHALESGTVFGGVQSASMGQGHRPARTAALTTTAERAHAINQLAWEFFTTTANISLAEAYLREVRGVDVGALCAADGGEPVVGYARTDWRALTRHLLRRGVTNIELLKLDLAQRSRNGDLVDTYRGRLIVPVLGAGGDIDGFIGRDTHRRSAGAQVPQPDKDTDVRQVDRALPANPGGPGPRRERRDCRRRPGRVGHRRYSGPRRRAIDVRTRHNQRGDRLGHASAGGPGVASETARHRAGRRPRRA